MKVALKIMNSKHRIEDHFLLQAQVLLTCVPPQLFLYIFALVPTYCFVSESPSFYIPILI